MANKRSRKHRRPSDKPRKPDAAEPSKDAVEKPLPPARPPKRNRPLLILSAVLMIGWIAFLLVVALTVDY